MAALLPVGRLGHSRCPPQQLLAKAGHPHEYGATRHGRQGQRRPEGLAAPRYSRLSLHRRARRCDFFWRHWLRRTGTPYFLLSAEPPNPRPLFVRRNVAIQVAKRGCVPPTTSAS
jgi:hypothetical protein